MHYYHYLKHCCFFILFLIFSLQSIAYDYVAPKAAVAPVIDGLGTDNCWSASFWYTMGQTWIGTVPTSADFSGRFKLSWDDNKLYLLAEITDDVLHDNFPDPLNRYYDDDALEILLDENKSGGEHEKNYNAFAYHISTLLDVVDTDTDGNPKLFNQNITSKWTKNGNVYTWECAITVFTDAYIYSSKTNPIAALTAGKQLGFSLAYCDNDGGESRQNFMGSDEVNLTDKNVGYKVATYFGVATLVDKTVAPAITFSQNLVASGLSNPTVMVCAPDGRIFICEQEGNLRIIKNNQLLAEPVLKVKTTEVGFYSERGLIGFAIDPAFDINNYIYVYYTTPEGGMHNRVSRFVLNGDFALPESEFILLELDPLGESVSHNGGAMAFGKDGKLYIATGDNQLTLVPRVSQDVTTTYGKLLRINADGTIPSDNPFDTGAGRSNLVWSYGLRNPFTFDIQPGTGRIFLNDVGEVAYEEINDASLPAQNFGWPAAEGMSTEPSYKNPEYVYKNHQAAGDSDGCAITGGVFFNPDSTNYPSKYIGNYFFMDFCNNWINCLDLKNGNRRSTFINNTYGGPVAIDLGPDGNLYYLSRTTSSVYKIVASDSPYPIINGQPDSTYTFASQPTVFTVKVSGKGPFTYQWKKNGIDIKGATSNFYSIPNTLASDAGNYTVLVTNEMGGVLSNVALLTVGPVNTKPVAKIISPAVGSLYQGGAILSFSGEGTDKEDGMLPAEQFTWSINFHHDVHVHDGLPVKGISNGTFAIPTSGETSDNVWYRVQLIVSDKYGLSDTNFVDVFPSKSKLDFVTQPPGLKIKLDGQPKITPVSTLSVQGITRSIGPVSPQVYKGKNYVFDHWADGGSNDKSFTTPDEDHVFTAIYKVVKKDTTILEVLQDAYVQDGTLNAADATTTFGLSNASQLVSKTYEKGPSRNILLKFDISSFTDSIQTARLMLFGKLESGTNPLVSIPVYIYPVQDTTWNEKLVTWNNKPTNSNIPLDSFVVADTNSRYFSANVAEYVRKERKSGKKQISFLLKNPKALFPRVIFNSKENAEGNSPQLVLTTDPIITVIIRLFEANASGELVTLSWKASHEQMNKEFQIYRGTSENGPFIKVGLVTSVSSINETNYNFTDQKPLSGLNYYKLVLVDKEGYEQYSNVISVFSNAVGVIHFNNDQTLWNGLLIKKDAELSISICDILGRELMNVQNVDIQSPLQLPEWGSGTYLMKLYDRKQLIYTKKLFFVSGH